MSYHVFFAFSSGLSKPLRVPKGTLDNILRHVAEVEQCLGYETEQYKDNAPYWKSLTPTTTVSDEEFCNIAIKHNDFVRRLYEQFGEWSKNPPADAERITPKDAKKFWHGLVIISVPVERWTADYYRNRMEHLYEVMRGRENERTTFDAKPLTIKQADAVINLFSQFLDHEDIRLAVPNDCDYLAASYDGGYTWCDKCGAVGADDFETQVETCRKRGCSLRAEYGEKKE